MPRIGVRKAGRPANPSLQAARRRQILDAAVELFARQGYSDTELDAVALKAGLAKGTIYRYYRSKTALFLATVDDGMQRLLASIDAARPALGDGVAVLTTAIRAYLTFFDAHPGYVELFMQERAQFRDRKQPTYFVHRRRNIEPWRKLVRQLIAAGRIRKMPVDRVLNVIGDLLYGAMFTRRFDVRKQSIDQQLTDILDVVFNGLLCPETRDPEMRARRKLPLARRPSA